MVYLLKDLSNNDVDAVIIAETSTKEEIEEVIDKVKEIDCYTWEDLIEALPNDCEVYDRWSDLKSLYY